MTDILQANVTIMVSDLDRSVDFYVTTLGMTLKSRYGPHWADIEGPGIAIGLHPTDKPVSRGDNMQIALRVADLEQAMQAYSTKGIDFTPHQDEKVKIAHFTDPDGNILYLVQPEW
jgi:catechol 2,3-dioxygenase-like lactoylglutathione lyase family enzyme